VHVDVLPGKSRTCLHGFEQGSLLVNRSLSKLLGEVEVIPTQHRIANKSAASISDVLFFFLSETQFLITPKRNRPVEAVAEFTFVELLFNRLP
jgi:hypothetical protein